MTVTCSPNGYPTDYAPNHCLENRLWATFSPFLILHRLYCCRQYRPDGSSSYCRGSTAYEDALLDNVREAIEYIITGKAIEIFASEYEEGLAEGYQKALEDAKSIQLRHQTRKQRLLDIYLDGNIDMDMDEHKSKQVEIESALAVVNSEIARIEAIIEDDETPVEKLTRLQQNLVDEPFDRCPERI